MKTEKIDLEKTIEMDYTLSKYITACRQILLKVLPTKNQKNIRCVQIACLFEFDEGTLKVAPFTAKDFKDEEDEL